MTLLRAPRNDERTGLTNMESRRIELVCGALAGLSV